MQSDFRFQGCHGWNAWQKTAREWEYISLMLSECSCRVSWKSFKSFLDCTELQHPSLCKGDSECCILKGFSCLPVDLLETTNQKFTVIFQEIPYRA